MRASQPSANVEANGSAAEALVAPDVLAADADACRDVAPLTAEGDVAVHGAVGMIRKSARDERRKRSTAYDHTEPYKAVVDKSGAEFDVRACKYCNAVFSFKGGTTSATLRHLKSAHPQEFFEGSKAVGSSAALAVDGDAEAAVGAEDTDQYGELRADLDPVQDPLMTVKPLETSSTTKKRRRYDDDVEGDKMMRLTANQQAITHFLSHSKSVVDVRMRLAFVKHLTYNDREADMYNVLDDETRLEFVMQFAQDQAPAEAPAGL